MKFLTRPGNSLTGRLCILLVLPLLLFYSSAFTQEKPDSVFEKVTLSLLKKDDSITKLKEGEKLLFLYLNGFTNADQRKPYYRLRDSAAGKFTGDTTVRDEARKRLGRKFDSAGISLQRPLSEALDDLMYPKDTSSGNNTFTIATMFQKDNERLAKISRYLAYGIAGIFLLAVISIILLLNKMKKTQNRVEELEAANAGYSQQTPPAPKEAEKKAKKLSEDLKKLKEEFAQINEQKNKLEQSSISLEKEKATLTKSLDELKGKHEAATASLTKTEKEKKTQEKLSGRLQEDVNKLSAIQKEQEEQARKMLEVVGKLETVVPPTSFPDINTTLHAWFLLQEFIKGYKTKEFSVLSTPNFSKWVLQQEHTYPDLDPTNLAGNAPIINFLIDLKKRKITKIAPDGSYMVLINQKITQPIFDSLETGE